MPTPRRTRIAGWAVALLLAALVGCSEPPSEISGPAPTPTASPIPTPTLTPTSMPTSKPAQAPTPTASRSASASCSVPDRLDLRGDVDQAWVFVPLDDPDAVVSEGRVDDRRAWSTSKVLVVAAYLDTAVGGDPRRLDASTRALIRAALRESDADAVTTVRDRIVGPPGAAMTRVLRRIGDERTVAPDSYQGLMTWSLRQQVRFMVALQRGELVSPAASRYLRSELRPADDLAWGLGRVGATTYKGGWLRGDTVTRQLGLLDGYAVAIATLRGPAVVQSDGDSAHVQAMNELARRLSDRLELEHSCR